ncbi:conserved hypothetical protein [Tenacibaculum aestuarii]
MAGVAAAIITTRYVNIAWGGFWCARWEQLFAFLLYHFLKYTRK